MIKLLLIFLLFLFIWPIFKIGYYLFRAHSYARRQQEAFRNAYAGTRSGHDGREPYGGDAGNPRAKRKKKVFSKTDGEYVEFEEISCDTASRRTETSADNGSTTFVSEEQVSDAEWTEIK